MADNNIIRRIVRIIFDRESAKQVEQDMNASLAGAGAAAGEATGREFLREMRKAFNKEQADLRVQLAKGLISPEEFRRASDEAARQFNAGILKGMEEARRAGTLTEREYEKLARQLKRVGDEGESTWGRLTRGAKAAAGVVASLFAVDRLIRFAGNAMKAALDARLAFSQLEAANRSTGAAAGFTTEQLKKQADALSLVSRFSSEAIQGGLTRLLTYTEIQGEMFQRASVAALDMAERLGIDVASAAEKVGNALNYPTKALNSLTRQGFRFTDQQTQQITAMEKAGNIAGAQAIILGELELAYGGAAKAANDALGPWGNLAKEIGRFRERFGEALLAGAEGTSVVSRLTGLIGGLADNAGRLLGILGSIAKASVIVGTVMALERFARAVRNTQIAIVSLRTAIAATWTALGPAGWFVVGVTAVAGAFELAASRSRKAAAEFSKNVDEMKASLAGLSTAQLEAEAEATRGRTLELGQRLEDLRSREPEVRFGRSGLPLPASKREQEVLDEIVATEKELALTRARGVEIAKLRGERLASALRTEADETQEVIKVEDDRARRQRERFEERRDGIAQEIDDLRRLSAAYRTGDAAAVADLQRSLEAEREIRAAVRDLTTEQAAAVAALVRERQAEQSAIDQMVQAEQNRAEAERALNDDAWDRQQRQWAEQEALAQQQARLDEIRRAVAVGAIQVQRETNAELHNYNREMYILTEMSRMGIDATSAFGQAMADLLGQSYDAANQFTSPWLDGMDLLREEVEGAGTLFHDLAQAWAQGGFQGIVQLAKAKVKENLAAAIENGAKALGALALGQVGASKNFAAAAVQHGLAAARWGVLAAAGGSGGAGSRTAGSAGSAIANPGAGSSTERAGPEVHIYLDPLAPEDYRVQAVVRGALSQAVERQGENATIRIHRRSAA